MRYLCFTIFAHSQNIICHYFCYCNMLIDVVYRLQDVVHSEKRLYLVFEYLDLDLKKHMDSCPEFSEDHRVIKVRQFFTSVWM